MNIQLSDLSPPLIPIDDEIYESCHGIKEETEALKQALIKKVVSTCLAELAVGSLITGAACCFVAAPLIPSFVIALITTVALTTLLHIMQARVTYETHQTFLKAGATELTLQEINDEMGYFLFKYDLSRMIRLVGRPHIFATLDSLTHGTLIHEAGHALAAWLLFSDSQPKITIHLHGGYTEFRAGGLTSWGEWLGYNRSRVFVAAAGPGLAMIDASILLIIAHLIKEDHPDWHWTLIHIAIQRVSSHVAYALSALTPLSPEKALSHDFHYLWKHANIHPVAAAVAMAALPILVQCALWAFRTKEG